MNEENKDAPAKRRGFGAMDPDRQREIARRGGEASHARGTAHEFTTETARLAGRKGGEATRAKRLAEQAGQEATNKASETKRGRQKESP